MAQFELPEGAYDRPRATAFFEQVAQAVRQLPVGSTAFAVARAVLAVSQRHSLSSARREPAASAADSLSERRSRVPAARGVVGAAGDISSPQMPRAAGGHHQRNDGEELLARREPRRQDVLHPTAWSRRRDGVARDCWRGWRRQDEHRDENSADVRSPDSSPVMTCSVTSASSPCQPGADLAVEDRCGGVGRNRQIVECSIGARVRTSSLAASVDRHADGSAWVGPIRRPSSAYSRSLWRLTTVGAFGVFAYAVRADQ